MGGGVLRERIRGAPHTGAELLKLEDLSTDGMC